MLAPGVEPWWTSNGMFEYIAERVARAVEPGAAEPLHLAAVSRIGGFDLTDLPATQRRAVLDYLAGPFVRDIADNPPDPVPASWPETVQEQRGLADRAGEALSQEE